MANENNLGITFPYQEDLNGKFLRMNQTDKEEIKSQLALLITTQKGQRLFKPSFGLNIDQFLFQPMDEVTYAQIRDEIVSTVTRYIPKLKIEKVETTTNESQNLIGIRISYSISDGILKESDEVNILF
jgi:phage baseplate assembly protein W